MGNFKLSILIILLSAVNCYSETYSAVSGDTFTVVGNNKKLYKICCMYAPVRGQFFYEESKSQLDNIFKSEGVYYEERGTSGKIFLYQNGKNICNEMIKNGFAWSEYKDYNNFGISPNDDPIKYNLIQLQLTAISSKYGLWAEPNQLHPSDYIEKSKKDALVQTANEYAKKEEARLAAMTPEARCIDIKRRQAHFTFSPQLNALIINDIYTKCGAPAPYVVTYNQERAERLQQQQDMKNAVKDGIKEGIKEQDMKNVVKDGIKEGIKDAKRGY